MIQAPLLAFAENMTLTHALPAADAARLGRFFAVVPVHGVLYLTPHSDEIWQVVVIRACLSVHYKEREKSHFTCMTRQYSADVPAVPLGI